MTIVEFVNARLDEEERAAKAATPGPWRHNPNKHWHRPGSVEFEESVFAGPDGSEATFVAGTGPSDDPQSMADAAHIALHDPARVLREIKAKRAIVAAYLPAGGDPHPGLPCINYEGQDPANYSEWDTCSRHIKASETRIHHDYVIRLLAAVHADHPDYDPAWAV